jgi:phage terminase large subunit
METINGKRLVTQECNRQFYDLINSTKRFKVHQGGTRSGKTHAICQYLAYVLTTSKDPLVISIIRKTLPALKGSVQRDFISILEATGLYYLGIHNKAENTFKYKKHLVEFLSVDEPQKIRGRKRNIAYLNEGNELTIEDFRQINMRTTDAMIIDFNPSDPVHWIYEEIIPREDCDTWITTYKDNKFLPKDLVFEIERMRERDPDYWRVYGEGQKAVFSARQIFSNWRWIPKSEFPEFDDIVLGVDFGYSNDPTAIVEIAKVNDKIYISEVCYKTGMTNQDIAEFLKTNGYSETLVFADSAEPKSIEELKRLGIWVKEAIKGAGSVNAGISLVKEFDIYASLESKNLAKEYASYYWTELKDGTIINKPIDRYNHLMDAIRYGIYSQYSKRNDFFLI